MNNYIPRSIVGAGAAVNKTNKYPGFFRIIFSSKERGKQPSN
jgi:hypothetical protein